ncbi:MULTISPECIES: hypothetical protein [Lentzea]|uniref:DUF3558 domain-containing protein n=2 Tax=Lentzea TaxID=165301 RepID=A0A1W2DDH1_9PSEU|nr:MULTISPECIES: hypothetical protein [Lentzea]MDX8140534.1 hypothetical protein [Lentzea sp. BCCO 10_0061]SMC95192.1 hypothetical protein SAMN05660733_02877 [Lentzea albidocapillata]
MNGRLVTLVLAATTLTATTLSGCGSIVPGTAKPESTPSSGKAAAAGACVRSNEPEVCQEWSDTKPKTGQDLLRTAEEEPVVAAQMLCSALPGDVLDRFLGAGHYRVIADSPRSPTCTISSDDNKKGADGKYESVIEVEIFLSTKESLARDLSILQSRPDTAAKVTELSIAGKPVMRVGDPEDANGQGRDKEELSIAVLGDKEKPGALRVRQNLRPPRGTKVDAPVDRARLDSIRDPLVAELLKTLFP